MQTVTCEFVMRTYSQFSVIPKVSLLALFSLCFPSIANPQDKAAREPSIPTELTAADPEIRALLDFENKPCKPGGIQERAEDVQKALQMADSRGLIGDRAIAEAALASVLIGEGKIDMAFLAFQKALQDSMDAKNDVLEADILIALASEAQVKGNTQQALELVSRALSMSERSGNLYEKAHALGELGRLNLLMGRTGEAASPIDEALNIDRLNGYKFEALHLVFQSYYLGLTGKEEQAVDLLSQAKTKAILTRNAYAFLMAENAYAFGLVRKGRTDEAIGEMELIRKGDLHTFIRDASDLDCLTFALELPLFHILFLEGLTNVLEASNLKEKEIEVWREVLSTSHNLGLIAGEAEAEQKIAQLESQLKRFDEAVKDYALAVGFYRSLQNEALLNQTEISESLLLVQLGRGKEALPLVDEVVSYAKNHNLRPLEFLANLELAEIYQPAGDLKMAREALERAESLIHPGPFDAEIDNHSIHEAYVRLSDIYRALKIPSQELVSTERAFSVSVRLKDEESEQREVAYLDQRLNELHIRDLVEESQKEGQLAESLLYSYILLIRDGAPSKPDDNQSNWQRIMTLPFQITQKPDGAAALIKILGDIGQLVVVEKLPILTALARYYISYGSDPVLAEKYALEAENVIKQLKGDMTSLKSEASCILAISYARQGKIALAKERIEECTSLAKKTEDQNTISYSDAANVLVQTQIGNIAAAKVSLENWVLKAPDNPEFHVELAMSLASAKLYDEAGARLDFAIQRFTSSGDKKTAAAAYTRVALALNSDQSEKAQRLQLLYLNSARQLYHALGAHAEEAETLIVLGDYYLKLLQFKTAIDKYQTAFSLAQKVGQPDVAAEGLLGLGNGYKAQKDFNRAAQYHLKAVNAYHNLKTPSREAISLSDLASDYYELGDTDRALTSFLEAKEAAKSAPSFNRYLVAYLLGDFYRSVGQFEKALATFNEAVEITTQTDDVEHSGYSHLAIAELNAELGDWDDALSESQIALDLFHKIGSREGQASSWAVLMGIYSDRSSSLKNFDKAQECYVKAKDFGSGDVLQLDLMEIYLQTGKYSEAAKIASENLAKCKTSQYTGCEGHALLSLSEAERLEGDLKDSRAALNKVRPLALKSQELYLRGRFLYVEARLLVSEGKLEEGLASYKQVISLIETVKGNLNAQEQRAISENYGYVYDELVSLLYSMSKKSPGNKLRYASDSLQFAEINKARQFAKSWGRVFVNQMRLTLPSPIQERERALFSQRDHILAQLDATLNDVGPNQKAAKSSLEADLSSVQGQIGAFLNNLRKAFPQYAAIAYPEDIQISTLPLRKGETLVEFKMTDDSTYVWVIQNREGSGNELVTHYEIRKKRTWFLDRLSLLRKGLNSGHPVGIDWKCSEEIFAELFPAEVAKIVTDSQEIIFVPDDVLFVLPFELFSPEASKGNFIFLNKAATYYPSAVSFRLARTAGHQANWQEAFLGVADPITSPEDDRFEVVGALKSPENSSPNQAQYPGDEKRLADSDKLKARGFSFERLPGTAIEVQSIASLLKARNETVDVRSGTNATKSELVDTDLSKFRFIHFATHGVLPVDTSIKEPSLVLSYDGVATSHMFLSMSEIIGLKLRSESVVLSACNTGSGKISRAEGVMSLGRAFLAAGSSSVTVSLWQVSDDSTALLMEKYYEGLLANKKKSIALAEARNAVFESGSKDPFFWAPFIVIGE
jgi:CHAT domain-containing protein/lipopolysaccharide biosynthesis regulator YciM